MTRLGILSFLLLAVALFASGCREKSTPEAPAKKPSNTPQKAVDKAVLQDANDNEDISPAQTETAPTPLIPDQVRIKISPETLDVLQQATLRLSAALPPERPEAVCRWILSGGADAGLDGCKVAINLDEAVADVAWTLVVTEKQIEILRQEGLIPLERLPGVGAPHGKPLPQGGESGLNPLPQGQNTTEISWSLTPDELGVLQDTEVALTALAPPNTECTWQIGDGEVPLTGCRVTHLFREAHRDQMVTLTVRREGEVRYSGTRTLPLERLPMTRRTPRPEGDLPTCGEGCRRLAVAAVTGDDGLNRAFALATDTGTDALALFLHEPLPEATAVEDLARHLGARGIGLIPVACGEGLGRHALTALLTNHALSAGLVLHSDAADLPARYALQWGPAFIAALPTRADIPDEKWLSGQLETAAMFRTRILLSCRAFDRLTGSDVSLLPSPYRQYEKMRRGGLGLFVSGAQRAFYPGTYGNLRTLSPGRVQGPSEALLGQETPQGPTAALLDLDEDRILRVTGVVPAGEGWDLLPADRLPEKVGVYRLWK